MVRCFPPYVWPPLSRFPSSAGFALRQFGWVCFCTGLPSWWKATVPAASCIFSLDRSVHTRLRYLFASLAASFPLSCLSCSIFRLFPAFSSFSFCLCLPPCFLVQGGRLCSREGEPRTGRGKLHISASLFASPVAFRSRRASSVLPCAIWCWVDGHNLCPKRSCPGFC